jgi:hypothetical protein
VKYNDDGPPWHDLGIPPDWIQGPYHIGLWFRIKGSGRFLGTGNKGVEIYGCQLGMKAEDRGGFGACSNTSRIFLIAFSLDQ